MKQILQTACAGLLSLLMLTLPVSVYAEETGGAAILLSDLDISDAPEQVSIRYYRFTDITETGERLPTADFAVFADDIRSLDGAENADLLYFATAMKNYVNTNDIPCTTLRVPLSEDLNLHGLEIGDYLLLIDDFETNSLICTFTPIIFGVLPDADPVAVTPKYVLDSSQYGTSETTTSATETTATTLTTTSTGSGTGSSVSTTSTTDTTSPPPLPQTGTQMWLVYLLAGLGGICLITLWGSIRSEQRKKGGKVFLLCAGLLLFGGAGYLCGSGYVMEQRASEEMVAALDKLCASTTAPSPDVPAANEQSDAKPDIVPAAEEAEPSEQSVATEQEMAVVEMDGNRYIGVLTLPKLSLTLPIADTCTLDSLRHSPGRLSGTADTDNLVLGAHNYKTQFGRISRLAAGDLVIFTDVSGVIHEYYVADITEVAPTETAAVCSSEHALAMFTCNASGARRIVVYCDAVDKA